MFREALPALYSPDVPLLHPGHAETLYRHESVVVDIAADHFEMKQDDVSNAEQARPRAYPTPEPSHGNPRTIFPRTQPPAGRPYVFGSVESPVSPTQGDRPHLVQPLRTDDRRAPSHYSPDDPSAIYAAQPTHYGALNTWGSFSSPTAKPEIMATTHGTMGPQPGSYHTPQSNSPVSVASPHHAHLRQMYPPNVQHPAHMYYPTYAPHQQQPHYGYPGPMQPPSLPSHNQHYQIPQYHPTHHMQQPQHPQQPHQPNFDANPATKLMQMPVQGPNSHLAASQLPAGNRSLQVPQQSSPGTSAQSAAAPGPIRATTPLVVKQDVNGVTTISFEYSKDRVKQPYEIRCDVESVDVKGLTQEHKNENCVYPRACSGEPYKGNRWQYENECNEVAWALAYLNPELKGKRGLIQRAVDSWRNSNRDRKLRSRRVRRMAKTEKRAQTQQQQVPNRMYGPPAVSTTPVPGSILVTNGLAHPGSTANAGVTQYHGSEA